MKPQRISEIDILDMINESCSRMDWLETYIWDSVKIDPVKWELHPWGDECGGFWVVGIIGGTVIWYNEIEEGFNRSRYSHFGVIGEYWCNQDLLEWPLRQLAIGLKEGGKHGFYASPPQGIDENPN